MFVSKGKLRTTLQTHRISLRSLKRTIAAVKDICASNGFFFYQFVHISFTQREIFVVARTIAIKR